MAVARSASETLAAGLKRLGVPDPAAVHTRLSLYLDEIERWNPRFGLVKAVDREELVVKHVLDSLSAWSAVRDAAGPRGLVLDVGSGAGFPGIPLAIALPDLTFTLLERMARRASFLKTCALLLGLTRTGVVQEDLAKMHGQFDVITFRAVAPLDRFLRDIEGTNIRWRAVIAYKGREERARLEADDVRRLWQGRFQVCLSSVTAPFLDEERCLATVIQGAGP
jgi:16S rRNA (guanine527-N7)-methyltransferase